MARTTAELVEGIIETEVSIPLTPFIDTANVLVTAVAVPLGYTDSHLEMIERWLSAHFYAIRDMRLARESVGAVQEDFQHKVGLNLNVTVYGQQVLVIDYLGGFANLQKRVEDGRKVFTPGVFYVGVTPAEQELLDLED